MPIVLTKFLIFIWPQDFFHDLSQDLSCSGTSGGNEFHPLMFQTIFLGYCPKKDTRGYFSSINPSAVFRTAFPGNPFASISAAHSSLRGMVDSFIFLSSAGSRMISSVPLAMGIYQVGFSASAKAFTAAFDISKPVVLSKRAFTSSGRPFQTSLLITNIMGMVYRSATVVNFVISLSLKVLMPSHTRTVPSSTPSCKD